MWKQVTNKGERSYRARFTNAEVIQIRLDHLNAKTGRKQVPKGWLIDYSNRLNIPKATLVKVLKDGYQT